MKNLSGKIKCKKIVQNSANVKKNNSEINDAIIASANIKKITESIQVQSQITNTITRI